MASPCLISSPLASENAVLAFSQGPWTDGSFFSAHTLGPTPCNPRPFSTSLPWQALFRLPRYFKFHFILVLCKFILKNSTGHHPSLCWLPCSFGPFSCVLSLGLFVHKCIHVSHCIICYGIEGLWKLWKIPKPHLNSLIWRSWVGGSVW